MKRSIKSNVRRRVAANRRRINEARQREEREQEAIRILVQQVQPEKDDIVGQYAASVIRVQRID